jgi:putative peptidoglycan lipid II flippase
MSLWLIAFLHNYTDLIPVKIGLLTILFNTLLSVFFLRYTNLGHGGLALAFSLTSVINLSIFLYLLRNKLGGIGGTKILITLLKSGLSSGVMGILSYYLAQFLGLYLNLDRASGRLIQVGVAILVGVIVYTLMIFLLRMEEVEYVLNLVRDRLKKSLTKF